MFNKLRYDMNGAQPLRCYETWLPADILPTRICEDVPVFVRLVPSDAEILRWEDDGGAYA